MSAIQHQPKKGKMVKIAAVILLGTSLLTQGVKADQGMSPVFYLSQFGSSGDGTTPLNRPFGVDCDDTGTAYVTDYLNHRVVSFDAEGNYISQFGGHGLLNQPQGITAVRNPDTYDVNVLVSDYGNSLVRVFNPADGSEIGQIGTGHLRYPWDVDVNNVGNIYVADGGNQRIKIFSKSGVHQGQFDPLGYPRALFVDWTSGNIYVAADNSINIFDPAGELIGQFGGEQLGNHNAIGIAHDDSGYAYISDQNSGCILIYKKNVAGDGTITYSYVSQINGFNNPEGITYSSDKLYVVESGENRVQVYWTAWDKWVANGGVTPYLPSLNLEMNGLRLTDGNTLVVPGGSALLVSGNLEVGDKTLTLDGGNVEAGDTLSIGNGGTLNNNGGNIWANTLSVDIGGTLYDRNGNYIYANTLNVKGCFKLDGGSLEAQTINVDPAGTLSVAGNLWYANVINVNGALYTALEGTTATGKYFYAGTVNVNNGGLFDTSGLATVFGEGNFHLDNLNVSDGGTVNNPTFTPLNVGSLTLSSTSTVKVAVNPAERTEPTLKGPEGSSGTEGTAGGFAVDAEATLDGDLVVSFMPDTQGKAQFQDEQTFTVLTASNISGTFKNVLSDPQHSLGSFLKFETIYGALGESSTVQVVLHAVDQTTGGSGQVVSPAVSNSAIETQSNAISRSQDKLDELKTQNQQGLGGKGDNDSLATSEFAPRPISYTLPPALLKLREIQEFTQRHPQREGWSTLYNILEQGGPIEITKELPSSGTWGTSFWISPSYTMGKNKPTSSSGPSRDSFEMLLAGFEVLNEKTSQLVGVSLGGGIGDTKSRLDKDNASKHKSLILGAYHSMRWGAPRWDVFVNVNHLFSDHTRVGTTGGRFIARGKDTTDTYVASTEFSYKLSTPDFLVLRPYYGLDYWHVNRGKYRESPNADPLSRPRLGVDGFDHYIGFMLRKTWTHFENYSIRIQGDFWCAYDLSTAKQSDKVFAVKDGSSVQVPVAGFGKQTFSPAITASVMNKETQSKYFVSYAATIQSKRISHQVLLKLQVSF